MIFENGLDDYIITADSRPDRGYELTSGPGKYVDQLIISDFNQDEIDKFLHRKIIDLRIRLDVRELFDRHYIIVDSDLTSMIYLRNEINQILYE